MRSRCAIPRASLRSLMVRIDDRAARPWRVSIRTAATPCSARPRTSHSDIGPASRPTSSKAGAILPRQRASASGQAPTSRRGFDAGGGRSAARRRRSGRGGQPRTARKIKTRWTKKHGRSFFGYKNDVNVDQTPSVFWIKRAGMMKPNGWVNWWLYFNRSLTLQFRGSVVTSDAGLFAYRELDDATGLTVMASDVLADARAGKHGRHALAGLLDNRYLVALFGYEDVNDLLRKG